jgi:hypothetical protein
MVAVLADTQPIGKYIPILSLAVALLAVVVGPLVTWKLTGRQLEEARLAADRKSSLDRKLANKQIVAPMRQAWIEKLRVDVASLLTLCNRYAARGTAEHNDSYDDIRQLILVIQLSLNSAEPDHVAIIEMLQDLFLTVADDTTQSGNDWNDIHKREAEIVEIAKKIFKEEWNRVKSEDAN